MKKTKYLDLYQATWLINDFKSIIGKPYFKEPEDRTVVQLLVLAPYSAILKWQFLRMIYAGILPNEAIKMNVNGRYDVLLIPNPFFNPISSAHQFIDLRSYLALRNTESDLRLLETLYGFKMLI